MEAADDADLHPGQGYTNIEHAQYDNSQYGFAQDAHPFPIDQSLEISVNFAPSDGKGQNEGLGNTHMSMSEQNGHSAAMRSHQGSTNTSGSLTTITQPQTPLNTATKRKSPEDTLDSTLAGGDSRRKRSKVSRACDQCRRKKVRCDADSGDGNLKTCTNCLKQGQTCDYNRIPQKRGPSKGYIKDLSERVHHLEDSLANAGNYRSSLDAGTYVDAPFSPEDDPTQRRPTSISLQRSPFADFTRDRFPSIGGWNTTTQISAQPRDRGSIAIPPDQMGPSQPPSLKMSRPRWITQSILLAEKTKTIAETEEMTKLLETTDMSPYYDVVHRQCPILPEKAKTTEILRKASNKYVRTFSEAMKLLPQKKNNDNTSHSPKVEDELEAFVREQSQSKWTERSNVDSLVLLWIVLLLHITYLHDIRSYAKQDVLISIELNLIDRFTKMLDFAVDPYEFEWVQTFHMVTILARLNALSHGNGFEVLPSNLTSYLNEDWQNIGPRTRYTAVMTECIQAGFVRLPKGSIRSALDHSGEQLANARLQDANLRGWLVSGVNREEAWVTELAAFMSLLSVQIITPGAAPSFIAHIVNLANTIRSNSLQQGSEERYLFNPVTFHAVSLATIALIELQSCHLDQQHSQGMVDSATNEMAKQLEELVKRRADLQGGAEGVFWAKTLLELVQEHAHPLDNKSEEDAVSGLTWILQRGYLEPLLMKVASK